MEIHSPTCDPCQLGIESPSDVRAQSDVPRANHHAVDTQPTVLTWFELANLVKAKLVEQALQTRRRWKSILGVGVIFGAILVVPLPYRIRCEVTSEPAVRRTISAPVAGQIERALLRPGDIVEEGQLLCMFNDDELQKEIASLRASRDQQMQKLNASLAVSDHSKAATCRLEAEFYANKIAILEKRLVDLRVCSPIRGVVVAGDLERAAGSTVGQGEILCEVAALDDMLIEVAIPEADILHVTEGMITSVTWEAEHLTSVTVPIESIHLRSELRNQESVFIAEASVGNLAGKLRPGMSGWASITTGMRPLGWILFHRPFHRLRQWTGL